MVENVYCEILISYTRDMPPTSLAYIKSELKRVVKGFYPEIPIKLKKVR